MSTFTDPAKAGELICGPAPQDGPARGDLDLLPGYGWWPEPRGGQQEAQEAGTEVEAGQ